MVVWEEIIFFEFLSCGFVPGIKSVFRNISFDSPLIFAYDSMNWVSDDREDVVKKINIQEGF